MALPDISFTNNIGSITFKRCLLDLADEWQWDGRAVVHRKRISVQGMMSRDASEAVEGILTTVNSPTKNLARRGALTLPWATLQNIRVESLEQAGGGASGWQVMVPVAASFVDDLQKNNIYSLTFFGLKLQNPRLSIPIPAKRTTDYFAQIPSTQNGEVEHQNPLYGPIRFRTGYEIMEIAVSGAIALESGTLPADIAGILQQRTGVTVNAQSLADLPAGYPVVFKLGQAIPELAGDLAISSVFVRRSSLSWNVEKQMAQVRINMVTQPQAWADQ
jgi:hypothetical protein